MALNNNMNLHTTEQNVSANGTMNVSPGEPYLSKTGAGTNSVELISLTKYAIDIFDDIKYFKRAMFPMLTIVSNLGGGKSLKAPVHSWTDIYENDAWIDLKLDDLRLASHKESWSEGAETWSNTYVGTAGHAGKMLWYTITTFPSEGTNGSVGSAIENDSNELGNTGGTSLKVQFGIPSTVTSDYIRGKKAEVIRQIATNLKALDYVETKVGDSSSYWLYTNTSGLSTTLYLCFEDLCWTTETGGGGTQYQDHEIIAGISKFAFKDDFTEIYIEIDFADSNADMALSDSNIINMDEVAAVGTTFDAEAGYTRLSRVGLISNFGDVPNGIPEGSDFDEGSGFTFGVEQGMNYTQIFQSKAYGITGTRLATKLRFQDDWQLTRRRKLTMYKQMITNALIYGKKSIRYSKVNGMPIRTFSGMLDYETFPIRYIHETLPSVDYTTGTAVGNWTGIGAGFADWLDSLAYSLNAYKEGDGQGHVLLTSKNIMATLDNWVRVLQTTASNVFGFTVETQSPDPSNLGIGNINFKTRYGNLAFVEEPALNYMPKFESATANKGGIPVHLFSSSINPRDIIIAIDKSQMQFLSLRPDKISGEIQKPGEDMYKEAIRGEHTFALRFPRNHMIINAGS